MPLDAGRVTVGTAATEIPVTCFQPWHLDIKNDDNTDAVYIGGPNVTTSTGLRLSKEERMTMKMAPLDRLYAVSTKAGHSVSYIRHTQAC